MLLYFKLTTHPLFSVTFGEKQLASNFAHVCVQVLQFTCFSPNYFGGKNTKTVFLSQYFFYGIITFRCIIVKAVQFNSY